MSQLNDKIDEENVLLDQKNDENFVNEPVTMINFSDQPSTSKDPPLSNEMQSFEKELDLRNCDPAQLANLNLSNPENHDFLKGLLKLAMQKANCSSIDELFSDEKPKIQKIHLSYAATQPKVVTNQKIRQRSLSVSDPSDYAKYKQPTLSLNTLAFSVNEACRGGEKKEDPEEDIISDELHYYEDLCQDKSLMMSGNFTQRIMKPILMNAHETDDSDKMEFEEPSYVVEFPEDNFSVKPSQQDSGEDFDIDNYLMIPPKPKEDVEVIIQISYESDDEDMIFEPHMLHNDVKNHRSGDSSDSHNSDTNMAHKKRKAKFKPNLSAKRSQTKVVAPKKADNESNFFIRNSNQKQGHPSSFHSFEQDESNFKENAKIIMHPGFSVIDDSSDDEFMDFDDCIEFSPYYDPEVLISSASDRRQTFQSNNTIEEYGASCSSSFTNSWPENPGPSGYQKPTNFRPNILRRSKFADKSGQSAKSDYSALAKNVLKRRRPKSRYRKAIPVHKSTERILDVAAGEGTSKMMGEVQMRHKVDIKDVKFLTEEEMEVLYFAQLEKMNAENDTEVNESADSNLQIPPIPLIEKDKETKIPTVEIESTGDRQVENETKTTGAAQVENETVGEPQKENDAKTTGAAQVENETIGEPQKENDAKTTGADNVENETVGEPQKENDAKTTGAAQVENETIGEPQKENDAKTTGADNVENETVRESQIENETKICEDTQSEIKGETDVQPNTETSFNQASGFEVVYLMNDNMLEEANISNTSENDSLSLENISMEPVSDPNVSKMSAECQNRGTEDENAEGSLEDIENFQSIYDEPIKSPNIIAPPPSPADSHTSSNDAWINFHQAVNQANVSVDIQVVPQIKEEPEDFENVVVNDLNFNGRIDIVQENQKKTEAPFKKSKLNKKSKKIIAENPQQVLKSFEAPQSSKASDSVETNKSLENEEFGAPQEVVTIAAKVTRNFNEIPQSSMAISDEIPENLFDKNSRTLQKVSSVAEVSENPATAKTSQSTVGNSRKVISKPLKTAIVEYLAQQSQQKSNKPSKKVLKKSNLKIEKSDAPEGLEKNSKDIDVITTETSNPDALASVEPTQNSGMVFTKETPQDPVIPAADDKLTSELPKIDLVEAKKSLEDEPLKTTENLKLGAAKISIEHMTDQQKAKKRKKPKRKSVYGRKKARTTKNPELEESSAIHDSVPAIDDTLEKSSENLVESNEKSLKSPIEEEAVFYTDFKGQPKKILQRISSKLDKNAEFVTCAFVSGNDSQETSKISSNLSKITENAEDRRDKAKIPVNPYMSEPEKVNQKIVSKKAEESHKEILTFLIDEDQKEPTKDIKKNSKKSVKTVNEDEDKNPKSIQVPEKKSKKNQKISSNENQEKGSKIIQEEPEDGSKQRELRRKRKQSSYFPNANQIYNKSTKIESPTKESRKRKIDVTETSHHSKKLKPSNKELAFPESAGDTEDVILFENSGKGNAKRSQKVSAKPVAKAVMSKKNETKSKKLEETERKEIPKAIRGRRMQENLQQSEKANDEISFGSKPSVAMPIRKTPGRNLRRSRRQTSKFLKGQFESSGLTTEKSQDTSPDHQVETARQNLLTTPPKYTRNPTKTPKTKRTANKTFPKMFFTTPKKLNPSAMNEVKKQFAFREEEHVNEDPEVPDSIELNENSATMQDIFNASPDQLKTPEKVMTTPKRNGKKSNLPKMFFTTPKRVNPAEKIEIQKQFTFQEENLTDPGGSGKSLNNSEKSDFVENLLKNLEPLQTNKKFSKVNKNSERVEPTKVSPTKFALRRNRKQSSYFPSNSEFMSKIRRDSVTLNSAVSGNSQKKIKEKGDNVGGETSKKIQENSSKAGPSRLPKKSRKANGKKENRKPLDSSIPQIFDSEFCDAYDPENSQGQLMENDEVTPKNHEDFVAVPRKSKRNKPKKANDALRGVADKPIKRTKKKSVFVSQNGQNASDNGLTKKVNGQTRRSVTERQKAEKAKVPETENEQNSKKRGRSQLIETENGDEKPQKRRRTRKTNSEDCANPLETQLVPVFSQALEEFQGEATNSQEDVTVQEKPKRKRRTRKEMEEDGEKPKRRRRTKKEMEEAGEKPKRRRRTKKEMEEAGEKPKRRRRTKKEMEEAEQNPNKRRRVHRIQPATNNDRQLVRYQNEDGSKPIPKGVASLRSYANRSMLPVPVEPEIIPIQNNFIIKKYRNKVVKQAEPQVFRSVLANYQHALRFHRPLAIMDVPQVQKKLSFDYFDSASINIKEEVEPLNFLLAQGFQETSMKYQAVNVQKYSSEFNGNYELNEWNHLPLLNVDKTEDSWTIFCGGKVSSVDFLEFYNAGKEYLAVATNLNKEIQFSNNKLQDASISIWELDHSNQNCELMYLFKVAEGPVWDIKFSSYRNDMILGVLAVTTGMGDTQIYSLPHVKAGGVLNIQPTLILRMRNEIFTQGACLDWSEDGEKVAVGFINGFVGIWDLAKSEKEGNVLHPSQCVPAHNRFISSVKFHSTEDELFLMTSSHDGKFKVFSLDDAFPSEVTCYAFKSQILCAAWGEHLDTIQMGVDTENNFKQKQSNMVRYPFDNGMNTQKKDGCVSSIVDLSINDDLEVCLAATLAGEVLKFYPSPCVSLQKKLQCLSYTDYQVVVEKPEEVGLLFCDLKNCTYDQNLRKRNIDVGEKRSVVKINRVCCSKNHKYNKNINLYAVGYETGFLRIKYLNYYDF